MTGVVCIAYQFKPELYAEYISEEDCAVPMQARLLMVGLCNVAYEKCRAGGCEEQD